jgi:serine/threonine protein kinase
LHAKSILYRDCKPDNILVSPHPRIKLADFGNVAHLPSPTSLVRGLEGTPAYMSPEMREGRHYGCTTDIWSLGITLLHLLFHNDDDRVSKEGMRLDQAEVVPDFGDSGVWSARKYAESQRYLSDELRKFVLSLFLKASERPNARTLLKVYFL